MKKLIFKNNNLKNRCLCISYKPSKPSKPSKMEEKDVSSKKYLVSNLGRFKIVLVYYG